MIAALSVRACAASRLELLLGLHPEERRWLTEEENCAVRMLKYVSPASLEDCQHSNTRLDAAKLWHQHYPELSLESGLSPDDLWDLVIADTSVLGLGYVFYPSTDYGSADAWLRRDRTSTGARQLQYEIGDRLRRDGCTEGKVTWTLPFPADGLLGNRIEARAGLTQNLKQGTGLCGIVPGLLHNFCYEHASDIAQYLSPRQFEELLASVYSALGWEVQLTRQVQDGGKDIIATREIEGQRTVVYVEAKRYRKDRPVDLGTVKEFAATVAGDGVQKGILVTTSGFSRPARRWAEGRGSRVARIELVALPEFREELLRTVGDEVCAYLFR